MKCRDAIKMILNKTERVSNSSNTEIYINYETEIKAILIGIADIDTKLSKFLGETPVLYKDGDAVTLGTTTILEKHVSTGWVFTGESL